MMNAALVSFEGGDYNQSEQLLLKLFGECVEVSSPADLLAGGLLLMGNIHATRQQISQCIDRYGDAFEILRVAFGNSHLGHATVLVNHSGVLIRQWQNIQRENCLVGQRFPQHARLITDALRMLTRAHNLLDGVLGVNRVILADCCHNMGVCLEIIRRPLEALSFYMKSLKIRTRIIDTTGLSELSLAATVENVAMLYRLMPIRKDPGSACFTQAAGEMMQSVIKIRRRILGKSTESASESNFYAGLIARDMGRQTAARALFQHCVRSYSQQDPVPKMLTPNKEISEINRHFVGS